jgi:L-carnitine CoA-transferase
MATTKDVPMFGCLEGVKVLSTGAAVAQPHAAELMAEAGATVIHAENAVAPDVTRRIRYAFSQEHRNQLMIALNIPTPEGKEIFLKLIKWADIWMESSKGGTYASWGLTDEYLWERLRPGGSARVYRARLVRRDRTGIRRLHVHKR